MKRNFKWPILAVFVCAIAACIYFFYSFNRNIHRPSLLYGEINITESVAHIPHLELLIENKTIPISLDLGLSGYISLDTSTLDEIKDKTSLKQSWKYGLHGIKRYHNVYQIPLIKMGTLTLSNIATNEQHPAFEDESVIILNKEKYNPNADNTHGRLGWMLFSNMSLFLDMKNLKMVVCGSVETFQKKEHSLRGYTKAPLFLDRDLVEFEAETSQGVVKCLLDTGCTFNIFNTPNPNDEPLGQMIQDETRFTTFSSFQISGQEFGPMTFRPLPIKLPIEVKAILGMEFFNEHRVLIDFKNHQIYFAKN